MSIVIETHRGKRIIRATYTDCETDDEMLQMADDLMFEVNAFDGEILVLSDFTDCYISAKFMARVKNNINSVKKKVSKSAAIGVTGLKKIFLNAYNRVTGRDMVAFDLEEKALEYLTSD